MKALLVVFGLCLLAAVQGLWLEVGYNEEHCFQEDYAKDLLVQVRLGLSFLLSTQRGAPTARPLCHRYPTMRRSVAHFVL